MGSRRAGAAVTTLCLFLAAMTACSSSGSRAAQPGVPSTPPTGTTPSASVTPSAHAQNTVWLCRPGARPNPCESDMASTAVGPDGTHTREPSPKTPHALAADCFYVYPTVSEESRSNADLRIQTAETHAAVAQASRFSSVCRVWAPMYRQRTLSSLVNVADIAPDSHANTVAFNSVESAWQDYLLHHNHGRPVVFIGHSQGAAMLVRLLRADIDPDPAMRAKVALAILLGANVTVTTGKVTGGSFQHLPLCTTTGERGCVIAYSSFPKQPPSFSLFGRPGLGVSNLAGETADGSTQVACVNPAAIGGGRSPLHPYYPTKDLQGTATTPWTSDPDDYAAACRSRGGATWLEVTPLPHSGDPRPALREEQGAVWGYHVVDVNVALGDLVHDVGAVTSRLR